MTQATIDKVKLARPTTCIWCKRTLTDGKIESGFTGDGPDWCDNGDYGCGDSPGTNEDDARLIAAATDLLAALERVFGDEAITEGGACFISEDAVSQARTAIQKARG